MRKVLGAFLAALVGLVALAGVASADSYTTFDMYSADTPTQANTPKRVEMMVRTGSTYNPFSATTGLGTSVGLGQVAFYWKLESWYMTSSGSTWTVGTKTNNVTYQQDCGAGQAFSTEVKPTWSSTNRGTEAVWFYLSADDATNACTNRDGRAYRVHQLPLDIDGVLWWDQSTSRCYGSTDSDKQLIQAGWTCTYFMRDGVQELWSATPTPAATATPNLNYSNVLVSQQSGYPRYVEILVDPTVSTSLSWLDDFAMTATNGVWRMRGAIQTAPFQGSSTYRRGGEYVENVTTSVDSASFISTLMPWAVDPSTHLASIGAMLVRIEADTRLSGSSVGASYVNLINVPRNQPYVWWYDPFTHTCYGTTQRKEVEWDCRTWVVSGSTLPEATPAYTTPTPQPSPTPGPTHAPSVPTAATTDKDLNDATWDIGASIRELPNRLGGLARDLVVGDTNQISTNAANTRQVWENKTTGYRLALDQINALGGAMGETSCEAWEGFTVAFMGRSVLILDPRLGGQLFCYVRPLLNVIIGGASTFYWVRQVLQLLKEFVG